MLSMNCHANDEKSEFVLSKKDIASFKIENYISTQNLIFLSGLAMHSSFSVSEILLSYIDDGIMVRVYMTPARKGQSGSFKYPIYIPDNISKVYFGDRNTLIWDRHNTQ